VRGPKLMMLSQVPTRITDDERNTIESGIRTSDTLHGARTIERRYL
jgi:hypothetical protein